jgi:membrane fusion protein, multidrug efflux system
LTLFANWRNLPTGQLYALFCIFLHFFEKCNFLKVNTMPAATIASLSSFQFSFQLSQPLRHTFASRTVTACAVLISLSLAACSKTETVAPPLRPALIYTITANAGLDSEVYAGEIRARVEADHAFRASGKIVQRLVDSGATVKKGQPLARIDPQDARLAAESARAQVSAQQTEADFAEAELKRFRELFAKGFVSQSALDQKINVAAASKARLTGQRALSDVAKNQAGYATLFAETDGVVTQVMAEVGQVVAPGQTVMKIANPNEKELLISIPEIKLAEFKAAIKDGKDSKENKENAGDRKLNVALWSQPKKYYPAAIREISGAADNVTRTYAARLTLDKPDDAVQLGMSAYAVLGSANEAGAMSVPLSSVYIKGPVTGVWLVTPYGKVALKPVTILQYRETAALIRAEANSIKPGDSIIAAGVHKLREGEIIKPIIDGTITGDGKVVRVPGNAVTALVDASAKKHAANQ